MKYIQYTLVDNKTNKPLSEAPAKNGPKTPSGVSPVFAIEDSFRTGVPTFYGTVADDFDIQSWMREETEDSFYELLKNEYKERARFKRKQVERGGVTLPDGTVLRTDIESQNRVSSLVVSVNTNPNLLEVDFEANPGEWVSLTRDQAIDIGIAVSDHVQSCFTWCKGVHGEIEAATKVITDYELIGDKIRDYGQEE